jgi:antitoxin VapB
MKDACPAGACKNRVAPPARAADRAVWLPKAVAFPDDVHRVDILKIGRSRVIVPQGKHWDDLFQQGPRATDDFMSEREQQPAEERSS